MSLVDGDQVEFRLFDKPMYSNDSTAKIKPSAQNANMLSYCGPRTLQELQSYFSDVMEKVADSSTRFQAVSSIMSSDALWFYFFNAVCEDDEAYKQFVLDLLDFIYFLADHMENFPSRRKEIFRLVLEKNLLENIKDQADKQSMEYKFLEHAVIIEPSLLKDVIPWIDRIKENNSSRCTNLLYNMLLRVADITDLSNWHSLTQIPSIKELLGDPLEKVTYLRPILLTSGYQNADDYLNVYYRLLRAECFSAMQKGIRDLRLGKLDARDMNVYDKVTVLDIDIEHTKIIISLQFTPQRSVSNWSKSKKLMFGNLLCISVKGDFLDPIWLTVVDRDSDILQKYNVIGVELVSFHSSEADSAETIRTMLLHSGKMIMAESPTYFQSFKHVLASLKKSEIEEFHLVNEIVHGKFMKPVSTVSTVIDPKLSKSLENIKYDQLEESQKKAFWHALNSTLGIIQGPPGTGKTLVGVKLVQMLLDLQKEGQLDKLFREPNNYESDYNEFKSEFRLFSIYHRPILVLTYKNHALDEFLKHCIDFCDTRYITRLGSQSKEDSLSDCLLHMKMKARTTTWVSSRYLLVEIEELFEKLSGLFTKLEGQKVFNATNFIKCLSLSQISEFASIALQKPWRVVPKNMPNNWNLQNYFGKWKNNVEEGFQETLLQQLIIAQHRHQAHTNNYDETMQRLIATKLLDAFVYHWLPNKDYLMDLTNLQQKGAVFFKIVSKGTENEEDDFMDSLDDNKVDELDEDYINEQLSLRTSAFDEDHNLMYTSKEKLKSMKMKRLEAAVKLKISSYNNSHQQFYLSDFPSSCAIDEDLLSKTDLCLWSMSDIDKYRYIYSFLHAGYDNIIEEMNTILRAIDFLQRQKKIIDEENKFQVLKTQKIVGATITGASVQLSLIQKLAPKVVLVEEAAEVLEPCLVAALTQSVEKLILIGDHKQLKPQVDTYHLRKEYNFHISMMERLINIGYPYEKLVRQGRMRPEFSCMLKDIYPEYQDFEGLAIKNKPIECLPNTMFFWSHNFEETKDRSVKNHGEANMVVALAMFFIASGVSEDDITILCAYLGQVQLVKKFYRTMNPVSTPSGDSLARQIDIRTIDEYQGDENRFVIVSLTRSNKQVVIGFLKESERRCVAQSRAKCGMYFIGNAAMFRPVKTWKPITRTMDKMQLINTKLPICCFRHPDIVYNVVQSEDLQKCEVTDKNQLMYYVRSKDNWCKVVCNVLFDCEIEDHRCKNLCTPRHDDSKCLTEVSYTFNVCGHITMKRCYIDEEDMKCRVLLYKTLPCGHEKTVLCHVWQFNRNDIICTETCSKSYSCPSKHDCQQVCGRSHSHDPEDCPVQVEFDIPACKHKAHFKKVCGKPIPQVKCKFQLKYKSEKCGHEQKRSCSEEEVCHHPCQRQRPDCGHLCVKKCSEPCLGGKDCEICETEYRNILARARKAAELQLDYCKKEAASLDHFSLLPISSDLDEFVSVTEKCKVFFSLYSNSSVTEMVNVWKVQCPSISIQFWDRASKAHGPLREELFKSFQGFLDMSTMVAKEDIFGHLTLSNCFQFTKYASGRLTSMPGCEYTMIISDILLGDCLDKRELDRKDTKEKSMIGYLKHREKDSIIEKKSNGPAAYTVYESCNILPTYIVHLKCGKIAKATIVQGVLDKFEDGEHKFVLSSINLRDVSDPIVEIVQKAISLYKGDCSKRDAYTQSRHPLIDIKAVGIVVNHEIERKYGQKKTQCKDEKVKMEEVFGYHATKPENVASIIKINLDPSLAGTAFGTAHGHGCYFSEHPEFSHRYGKECMFIFKVMLIEGKYTKVQPDGKGFCQQLVVPDASLFKPVYVLYF